MSDKDEAWEQFQKEELHKVALNAYVNNGITFDRLLLAINLAMIGFISKYLFEIDSDKITIIEKGISFLLLFSVLFLIISSYKIMKIFDRNREYLQNILNGKMEDDKILEKLDEDKIRSLKIGVILFFISLMITLFFKLY